MTSKIVVNNIEADSGINTVTFNSNISGNFVGNVNTTGLSTFSNIRVTGGTISGVSTAGITTAYIGSVNDGSISGARNRIINGDMRIDQRNGGASLTISTGSPYTVDRWRAPASQSSKFTVQQQAIVSPQSCDGHRYTLACSTASVVTPGASDYFGINQFVEGYNMSDLLWGTSAAKSVTLSFWIYCGLTGSFGGAIRTGDSANYSYPFTYTINSANTWEYKRITIPGPTAGTWNTTNGQGLDVWFSLGTGSTFSGTANTWAAANYVNATGTVNLISTASASGGNWYLTGVQLEPGTVATPFERRSYGQELALAQRYYVQTTEVAVMCNKNTQYLSTTTRLNPVPMRSTPVLATSGTYTFNPFFGNSQYTSSNTPTLQRNLNDNFIVNFNMGASTEAAGFGEIYNATISLSAEL